MLLPAHASFYSDASEPIDNRGRHGSASPWAGGCRFDWMKLWPLHSPRGETSPDVLATIQRGNGFVGMFMFLLQSHSLKGDITSVEITTGIKVDRQNNHMKGKVEWKWQRFVVWLYSLKSATESSVNILWILNDFLSNIDSVYFIWCSSFCELIFCA